MKQKKFDVNSIRLVEGIKVTYHVALRVLVEELDLQDYAIVNGKLVKIVNGKSYI